jgi:hypothetical protein
MNKFALNRVCSFISLKHGDLDDCEAYIKNVEHRKKLICNTSNKNQNKRCRLLNKELDVYKKNLEKYRKLRTKELEEEKKSTLNPPDDEKKIELSVLHQNIIENMGESFNGLGITPIIEEKLRSGNIPEELKNLIYC